MVYNIGEENINVNLKIMNGGINMATSSITKKFVTKDVKACQKMLAEVNEIRQTTTRPIDSPKLKAGEKALKQFSFR